MADEIVVSYKVEVDGLKAQMQSAKKEFQDTAVAAEQSAGAATAAFNKTATSTQSLRTQLKNLKADLAVATDPKDVERLARAAGDITDKLDDATQAAKIFASESKFEQIRTALGGIGRSVASLDFKQAASQAKLLQSAVASLTFKEAVGGLKNLGSTFLSIGKTLLLNPLFYIPALIVSIGVAVLALKDKIPLLTKAFDFVGESVKKIKNFVTGITDSLGFTTVATDKAFDRLIALGKEVDEQRERRKLYQEEQKKLAEEAAAEKKIREDSIETYKVQFDQQQEAIKEANKKKNDAIKEADDKAREEEKEAADAKLEEDKERKQAFTDFYKAKQAEEAEEFQKQMQAEIDARIAQDAAFKQAAIDLGNALFFFQDDIDQRRLQNFKGTEEQKEKLSKELSEKKAKRDKAQALFNIAIATAENIVKAGANIPLAIAMGIIGAIQAALVLSKPIPKFAKGVIGLKRGNNAAGVDTIPALLNEGESVMTTQETNRHRDLFEHIRNNKYNEYIGKKHIQPVLSELIGSSLAENLAKSASINFPDEYALSRVMKRNKGVQVENADYLASRIATAISNSNHTKRGWS